MSYGSSTDRDARGVAGLKAARGEEFENPGDGSTSRGRDNGSIMGP